MEDEKGNAANGEVGGKEKAIKRLDEETLLSGANENTEIMPTPEEQKQAKEGVNEGKGVVKVPASVTEVDGSAESKSLLEGEETKIVNVPEKTKEAGGCAQEDILPDSEEREEVNAPEETKKTEENGENRKIPLMGKETKIGKVVEETKEADDNAENKVPLMAGETKIVNVPEEEGKGTPGNVENTILLNTAASNSAGTSENKMTANDCTINELLLAIGLVTVLNNQNKLLPAAMQVGNNTNGEKSKGIDKEPGNKFLQILENIAMLNARRVQGTTTSDEHKTTNDNPSNEENKQALNEESNALETPLSPEHAESVDYEEGDKLATLELLVNDDEQGDESIYGKATDEVDPLLCDESAENKWIPDGRHHNAFAEGNHDNMVLSDMDVDSDNDPDDVQAKFKELLMGEMDPITHKRDVKPKRNDDEDIPESFVEEIDILEEIKVASINQVIGVDSDDEYLDETREMQGKEFGTILDDFGDEYEGVVCIEELSNDNDDNGNKEIKQQLPSAGCDHLSSQIDRNENQTASGAYSLGVQPTFIEEVDDKIIDEDAPSNVVITEVDAQNPKPSTSRDTDSGYMVGSCITFEDYQVEEVEMGSDGFAQNAVGLNLEDLNAQMMMQLELGIDQNNCYIINYGNGPENQVVILDPTAATLDDEVANEEHEGQVLLAGQEIQIQDLIKMPEDGKTYATINLADSEGNTHPYIVAYEDEQNENKAPESRNIQATVQCRRNRRKQELLTLKTDITDNFEDAELLSPKRMQKRKHLSPKTPEEEESPALLPINYTKNTYQGIVQANKKPKLVLPNYDELIASVVIPREPPKQKLKKSWTITHPEGESSRLIKPVQRSYYISVTQGKRELDPYLCHYATDNPVDFLYEPDEKFQPDELYSFQPYSKILEQKEAEVITIVNDPPLGTIWEDYLPDYKKPCYQQLEEHNPNIGNTLKNIPMGHAKPMPSTGALQVYTAPNRSFFPHSSKEMKKPGQEPPMAFIDTPEGAALISHQTTIIMAPKPPQPFKRIVHPQPFSNMFPTTRDHFLSHYLPFIIQSDSRNFELLSDLSHDLIPKMLSNLTSHLSNEFDPKYAKFDGSLFNCKDDNPQMYLKACFRTIMVYSVVLANMSLAPTDGHYEDARISFRGFMATHAVHVSELCRYFPDPFSKRLTSYEVSDMTGFLPEESMLLMSIAEHYERCKLLHCIPFNTGGFIHDVILGLIKMYTIDTELKVKKQIQLRAIFRTRVLEAYILEYVARFARQYNRFTARHTWEDVESTLVRDFPALCLADIRKLVDKFIPYQPQGRHKYPQIPPEKALLVKLDFTLETLKIIDYLRINARNMSGAFFLSCWLSEYLHKNADFIEASYHEYAKNNLNFDLHKALVCRKAMLPALIQLGLSCTNCSSRRHHRKMPF